MNKNFNNRKSAGKRRFNGKSNSKSKTLSDEEYYGKKGKEDVRNDPSWYLINDAMRHDVASLSYNSPTGVPLNRNSYGNSNVVTSSKEVMPGIMNIYVLPTPGYAGQANDAVNIAAKNIYSWVRHANSGSKNYESQDLMMYLLAMDSAYSMYAWMLRLYGLCKYFIQQNRYYGDALITACGVDPEDLRNNLANFRSFLNIYAVKLSPFAVPEVMKYFDRHSWMFSNAFKDEDDLKAQIYMYQPAALYIYDELGGAGHLEPLPIAADWSTTQGFVHRVASSNNLLSVANIFTLAGMIIDPIIESEDMGIMSGDILKAYGESGLRKLVTISDDFAIEPMYSMEVLTQLHNTSFVGNQPVVATAPNAVDMTSLYINQQTGVGGDYLEFMPAFRYNLSSCFDSLLDLPFGGVSEEQTMVATRNLVSSIADIVAVGQTNVPVVFPEVFGAEIPLFITMWWISPTTYQLTPIDILRCNSTELSFNGLSSGVLSPATAITAFNQHPRLDMYDSNARTIAVSLGEVSNFVIVPRETLRNMHTHALLAMYAVPYPSKG